MLISVIGCHRGRNSRGGGFTLVEVLVVLLVIALVGSVVALSVDSGSRSYEIDSANRLFRSLAQQAGEEAELTGLDHGLTIEPVRDDFDREIFKYRWWRRTQDPLYTFFDKGDAGSGGLQRREAQPQWETQDDILYRSQSIPPGIELSLTIADIAVDLRRRGADSDARRVEPLIVFYASGESSPATIEWIDAESDQSLWRYQWDLLGQLELETRGAVADESP